MLKLKTTAATSDVGWIFSVPTFEGIFFSTGGDKERKTAVEKRISPQWLNLQLWLKTAQTEKIKLREQREN